MIGIGVGDVVYLRHERSRKLPLLVVDILGHTRVVVAWRNDWGQVQELTIPAHSLFKPHPPEGYKPQ